MKFYLKRNTHDIRPEIYLISPPKLDLLIFPNILTKIFEKNIVRVFQLRLKESNDRHIIKATKVLYPICKYYKVLFILNDRLDIAKKLGVDGVHLGKEDESISKARYVLGPNKIIGSSCYNTISLSLKSQRLGADYVAFGSFFKTNTKKNTTNISALNLRKYRKYSSCPVGGIGGFNQFNIKKVAFLKLDFLAFCSAIWYAKDSPLIEIKKIKKIIDTF